MLSPEQSKQYARQIILPGFGLQGQEKIIQSNVLIVGCGGLGCPVAMYLAGAGVGHIGLIDADKVTLSNLHRQVSFKNEDIGKSKVKVLGAYIQQQNPSINISEYPLFLNKDNALDIIKEFELVIDCSDNFQTRYLVNDACEILQKPFIFGAVHQMEAQMAVFNYQGSATYRDVFPEPPPTHLAPDCSVGGVIGALVGIVGSFQALECIKIITGIGKPLVDQMLVFDTNENYYKTIKIKKIENREKISFLIDYDKFCSIELQNGLKKEIFDNLDKTNTIIIDVRNKVERDVFHIGGINIPVDELTHYDFKLNKTYVFYCQSGQRSKAMYEIYKLQYPKSNFEYLNENLDSFI